MPRKARQLIGATALLLFIPLYALTAMLIAGAQIRGASVLVQTIYFAIAGLLWIVPAGAIIAWMQRR